MLNSLTNPETWQAARSSHELNPASHPSRVFARRWKAAGAAAALAPVRDSHVRSAGYAGLTCSDTCTALLIQELLTPGDAMRAGVLARMLQDTTIDLGHVRLALTAQAPAATRHCIVDCTAITPDGPDFTTSLQLWTRANDQAELKLAESSPTAYLNTRTGEVLLAGEVQELTLSALELHLLLSAPMSQRSAFIAELERARQVDSA